jgi:formiminotetrahydrofolate cyclodeaminase
VAAEKSKRQVEEILSSAEESLEEEEVDTEPVQTTTVSDLHSGQKLTKMSVRFQDKKCVKEHLFPKIKFINTKTDLQFSNNPNSICRFMAGKLMVDDKDIETWWGNAAITTHTSLKTQRNNVIINIKHVFMGKNTAVMYNWIVWNTKI